MAGHRAEACGWRPADDDEEDRGFRKAAPTGPALRAQQRLDELLGLDHDPAPDARPTVGGVAMSVPLWTEARREMMVFVRASLGVPGAPWPGGALGGIAR